MEVLEEKITRTIGRYALGAVVIAGIAGTVQGTAAWILGIPFALALGIVAGLLGLIPQVGATLAAVVLSLVGLTQGIPQALVILAVCIGYQQFENYVLQPTIQGRAADISGFFVIASVVIGAALLGVVGALIAVPGVPLSEADEAELALDLAVRDVAAAEEILATQLTRFANPDRRARFAFVMPAAARDAPVRARFFESLKDVDNRRREAWVLEAARLLHHPLRAAESAALVRPALALVWEIQRTGDIFFPKRWTDATLSGYQSDAVARDVRAFIDGLPAGYPPRLRWVLLASADPLFRAARGGGGA